MLDQSKWLKEVGNEGINFVKICFNIFTFFKLTPPCRLHCITARLEVLASSNAEEIIQLVGNSYRTHYRMRCRGVSWYHQLHSLQLIAVCLGKYPTLLFIWRIFTFGVLPFRFSSSVSSYLITIQLLPLSSFPSSLLSILAPNYRLSSPPSLLTTFPLIFPPPFLHIPPYPSSLLPSFPTYLPITLPPSLPASLFSIFPPISLLHHRW